jgi:hypothetical protein
MCFFQYDMIDDCGCEYRMDYDEEGDLCKFHNPKKLIFKTKNLIEYYESVNIIKICPFIHDHVVRISSRLKKEKCINILKRLDLVRKELSFSKKQWDIYIATLIEEAKQLGITIK